MSCSVYDFSLLIVRPMGYRNLQIHSKNIQYTISRATISCYHIWTSYLSILSASLYLDLAHGRLYWIQVQSSCNHQADKHTTSILTPIHCLLPHKTIYGTCTFCVIRNTTWYSFLHVSSVDTKLMRLHFLTYIAKGHWCFYIYLILLPSVNVTNIFTFLIFIARLVCRISDC